MSHLVKRENMTVAFAHGWETFETFDFSRIITEQDQELAKADIRQVIADGKYFTNSPKYQTNINIFNHPGEHWLKFRQSFIMSCFMYLKQEVKIEQIQSWSFMTSNNIVENRDDLWHTHQYGGALNGTQHPERYIAPVLNYTWLIYPGKTWHRPMPPQSSQDRFVIAADMVF